MNQAVWLIYEVTDGRKNLLGAVQAQEGENQKHALRRWWQGNPPVTGGTAPMQYTVEYLMESCSCNGRTLNEYCQKHKHIINGFS